MTMLDLLDFSRKKTLICFGAGQKLLQACAGFSDVSFFERIDFIADNNNEKHIFCYDGEEKPVYSIETCLKQTKSEPLILITMVDFIDVIEQLDSITELDSCCCFLYSLMNAAITPYKLPKNRTETESIKIPKTIHYCWFGNNPIPDSFTANIETWKKYCPDYEIVRWDERNYDYKKNKYMYDAYEHKKWGFVPDFARLDIIYRYGGVYLDTDVELVRNINDLLCDDAFCGFESRHYIANGLGFGAVAGFSMIKEQLSLYDTLTFTKKDNSLNLKPAPQYQTELLCGFGLQTNNTLQKIQGMKIYPNDVLSPLDAVTGILKMTENTYSIHHYAASWFDEIQQEKKRKLQKLYTHMYENL